MRIPAEERKKMIVRSAINVFSQSNYKTAKVSEIAELAGVTEPMVYRYFQTKKNLFLETLTLIGEKTERMMQQSGNVDEYDDCMTCIEAMTNRYLDSMERYKKEVKIYYQAISEMDDEDIKGALQKIYRSFAKMYSAVVAEGQRRGQMNENIDADAWSWNMVGIFIHLSAFFLLKLYDADHAKQMIDHHFALLEARHIVTNRLEG